MNPPSFRLVTQPRSPYLYADYPVWDAAIKTWTRKFTSTGFADKARATTVAAQLASTAHAVAEGVAKGWSRKRALQLLNDMERAAGLPVTVVMRSWQDLVEAWRTERKPNVTESSMVVYEQRLAAFAEFLGPRVLRSCEDITGADCQKYYQWLITGGKRPSTANQFVGTIEDVFERARGSGWCQANPASLVSRHVDHRRKVVKEPFSPEEIQKLLAAAANYAAGDEWVTMILLSVCIGARMQDCVKLGVSNLNRAREPWTLRYTPQKTERHGTVCEVPVVEPLRSHLQKLLKKRKHLTVFCPSLGKRTNLSKTFASIAAKAGISQVLSLNSVTKVARRSKTFHSLRHTLPTWLKAAGVDSETRMKIVGHTSKEVHAGYTHMEMSHLETALKSAMKRLIA